MIKYGLKHIKENKLLTFSSVHNDDESESVDNSYYLSTYIDDPIWTIDTPEEAEYVRNYSTEWYNASIECPKHDYQANELKVVKLINKIEDVNISIPCFEEILKFQGWTDIEIKKFIKKREDKKHCAPFSIYELREYIRNKK